MDWFLMGLLVVCVTVTHTDAECHCSTTDACSEFPSTPCRHSGDPKRCQEGWFGPYCQRQNVALGRSYNQSSTLNNNVTQYGAGLGVDGRATTDAHSIPLTCAHTSNETDPTWTLNLNTSRTEKIQHIRLYLRNDLLERNNGMEILIGSQMCYNWSPTEHPPPIANVTCRQPLTGTTVTIRVPGPGKFLTLCEVQIFVCSDGWFSENCDRQCQCLNRTEICDKITGHCSSGCFPGYYGTDCLTACRDYSFGSKCSSKCGNCLNGDSCDKTNGTCPAGCAPGWQSDTTCLQACPNASYGINCASSCGNCVDGDSCDKANGTCPSRCAAGWMNDDAMLCLQPCPDGSYGINCASQCGNCVDGVGCDTKTGTCPGGCAAGWINDGTCLQKESNWGIPVTATLGALLIFTVIGATIYIRRLMKELESLKSKISEGRYVELDVRTKTLPTESTYEHIDIATPYYNTVDHVQGEN
ncbi:protein draper-like [Haliotis rufescens]|uniref:protein draper-like n=1 Tax=Haliotis rufescens TaxID=6454 RepID=UPI00201EDF9E|nr:protein draper-like [Haliotis rufescens]